MRTQSLNTIESYIKNENNSKCGYTTQDFLEIYNNSRKNNTIRKKLYDERINKSKQYNIEQSAFYKSNDVSI